MSSARGGDKRVRIGVVGLGAVARDVHIPLLRELSQFEIAVLTDPERHAMERAASSLGGSVVQCKDPLAVCRGESAPIDAVLIASPTRFHAEQAAEAVRAGLHVYLEKPLAAGVEEGEQLAGIPLASGQVVQVGFNYRFDPAYTEMAHWVGERRQRQVQQVSMTFRAPLDPRETWRQDDRSGGGVLLDLFSHDVDLVGVFGLRFRDLAATQEGDTVTVTGSLVPSRSEASTPTDFIGEYGYRSADVARCRLTAEDGEFGYDRYRDLAPRWQPKVGGVAAGFRDVARQARSLGVLLDRRRSPWRQPTYRLALQAFAEAVANGPGRPLRGVTRGATVADGLEALRVVDAARQSLLQDGRSVQLSEAGAAENKEKAS